MVNAKYAYIKWSNKTDGERTLSDLAGEIRKIAVEKDIKYLPDYAPPSVQKLADSVRSIENAKAYLLEGDKISYVVPGEPPVDFDMGVSWSEEELHKMEVKEAVKVRGVPITFRGLSP